MLSHELRNPMGAVLNALEVLQSEIQGELAEGDPRHVIDRQTRHMARLLDDLLDVARIGQNKIEFRREVVDLCTLANDVLESVQHEFTVKQQKLRTKISSEPLYVFADPARIKQAQINLLTNASKYTFHRGSIWYAIERQDDTARIVVRDSGEGIPHDLLQNIFDLFVQSETTLARSSGGMGVGLSLARSIIEAHDGTIAADSAGPGQGSTFRIELPLTDKPPKPKIAPPHFAFGGRRLLLVEDNDDARTMLAKALRLQDFEVADAGDGRTALEQFDAFQPNVAIIDIGLPVMNGYQLAQQIRQDERFVDTILIALTGYGRNADRQAAFEAGFDAHLVKPLNPTDLYEMITNLQAERAAQRTSSG